MWRPTVSDTVYLVSFGVHLIGGLWLGAIEIHRAPPKEIVEVRTVEKPKPPKPTPPPPEAPKSDAPKAPTPKPAPAPKAAPKPAPAAAVAPSGPAVPDFGIALSGGGGPGGIAIPTGGGAPAPTTPKVKTATKTLAPAAAPAEACEGEDTKAKPINMPHPAYTDEARAAAIEGKVRVELTIDASGKVTKAAVVTSLGHGLDEAALTAVRGATFTPATHCGKPVPSTFVISVRFAL